MSLVNNYSPLATNTDNFNFNFIHLFIHGKKIHQVQKIPEPKNTNPIITDNIHHKK